MVEEAWARVDAVAKELDGAELSSEQRRAMRAALEGRDALVAMPAGIARVACAVVPARLSPRPTLIVGPRPALLRELHDKLLQRRVPVVRVDGSLGEAARRQALERVAKGGSLVVLTTATYLAGGELVGVLLQTGLAFVAVDDAHTATPTSDEHSPAAGELPQSLAKLGGPPVMALVGPVPAFVRLDVIDALGLRSPVHVETSIVPRSLSLAVVSARGEARERALLELIADLRRPGLVLAPTAREVDAIYATLAGARLPVHRYHSHMAPGERVGEQLNFMLPGRRSVMVATSGLTTPSGLVGVGEEALLDKAPADLGLGLEKRDLRFLIHWAQPASLEQYARELALVGRDGEEATAVLFHDAGDRARHEATLAQSRIPSRHLVHFARALGSLAADARPRTLEALALSSGLSRRVVDALAAILADSGVLSFSSGWVRAGARNEDPGAVGERLAARLDRLRAGDGKRLAAVEAYVSSAGCRAAALARHFGEASADACGRCDVCRGSVLRLDTAAVGSEPAAFGRRASAETFSVRGPGDGALPAAHSKAALAAGRGGR
jgi:ATP-dependent DNA helicase RecQ